MRRGGEGGVKGPDRVSGGVAALDTARASAMPPISGNVNGFIQCKTGSNSNFAFIRSRNCFLQAMKEASF